MGIEETYKVRVEKLRRKMEEEGLDALFIFSPPNLFYLSGCEEGVKILLTRKRKFLLTSPLYQEEIEKKKGDWEVVVTRDWEKNLFSLPLGKRMGFESHLPFETYKTLAKHKKVHLSPCKGWVEELRKRKDGEEIRKIKKAKEVSSRVLSRLRSLLKPGVKEKDLLLETISFFRREGGREAFEPIILFGERTSLPHGKPGERKFKKGELALLDLGIKLKGYCSDLTLTFLSGKLKEKWKKIFEMVEELREGILERLKPGVKVASLEGWVRKKVAKEGMEENFLSSLGHGVGIEIHEAPHLSRDSKEILEEGMVVTVEPGLYFPGEGGVREEIMVLITKRGRKVL